MNSLFILVNVILLVSISILHFYWAFGGTWALSGTLPERFQERFQERYNKRFVRITDSPVMILLTVIVALGLLFIAGIIALNSSVINFPLDPYWVRIGTLIIGVIFLLRAIGDFGIVGLFKTDRRGVFAERDTKFYIPLCLVLSINSFLILVM